MTESESNLWMACLRFCAFKDAVDTWRSHEKVLEDETVDLERTFDAGVPWAVKKRAATPSTFVECALPFSVCYYNYDTMVPREVDPRLVVSGTYNHYGACSPDEVMDFSDSLACEADKYCSESPRLAQIGDLPLYVALEGKNRVELFKRFRRRMKALVTCTPFPEADRLEVFRIRPWGFHAVSHEGRTVPLPFDTPVVPILAAYGAKASRPVFSLKARSVRDRLRRRALSSAMRR